VGVQGLLVDIRRRLLCHVRATERVQRVCIGDRGGRMRLAAVVPRRAFRPNKGSLHRQVGQSLVVVTSLIEETRGRRSIHLTQELVMRGVLITLG
jgi:hypothetical protein